MNWHLKLALIFLTASCFFNTLHYLVFEDAQYIFKFILVQLGFLPISVFLVTMVLNQLLARREKMSMLNKLNMVIGSFYSEVGTNLLAGFSKWGGAHAKLRPGLLVRSDWQSADFSRAEKLAASNEGTLDPVKVEWQELRTFLAGKKTFLLGLLANPNLLEHERFTDLLWAVFHLAEELEWRRDVSALSDKDYEHLIGDLQRVQGLLLIQWLQYLRHLQVSYPYLFSLAVRINPFDPEGGAEFS